MEKVGYFVSIAMFQSRGAQIMLMLPHTHPIPNMRAHTYTHKRVCIYIYKIKNVETQKGHC